MYSIQIGYKFNYLTVVAYVGKNKRRKNTWKCLCLCGKNTVLEPFQILGKKIAETCGCCEWHINHSAAYNSWQGARQRVYNKNCKGYL